jgi:leucyl-tRNA synthetase
VFQHRERFAGLDAAGESEDLSFELRELRRRIHRTVKKVTEDIEGRFHFNTAIAAIMELFNAVTAEAQDASCLNDGAPLIKDGLETMIVMLAPFVPHLASELWEELGHRESLNQVPWPVYSLEALEEEKLLIVVQINGKVRGKITVPADATQERIQSEALADSRVAGLLNGKKVQRVVYVPRRLLNIVVEG